jgi:hypothetical protein
MRLALACALLLLSSCEVVPPGDDAGSSGGKVPGAPFGQNSCFRCSLQACAQATNACALDTVCSGWLSCVSACTTAADGVSVASNCACGVPVSAQVLTSCVEDFSTGFLRGCEQACTPLSDAGT